MAEWLVAVGTILLAIMAAFQDRIRAVIHGPKLDCRIEAKPPDCHRTESRGNNVSFHSYFCWFEIWNTGKTSARNVEVIISNVSRKRENGFEPLEEFFPDNLRWSLLSEIRGSGAQGVQVMPKIYCDYISPGTFKPCNLGHIHDPNFRTRLPGEDDPSLPIRDGDTVFCFEVNFRSNRLNYLVQPGSYEFTITVGCENAKTISKKFLLEVTGAWFEDESKMLNEGLRIAELG